MTEALFFNASAGYLEGVVRWVQCIVAVVMLLDTANTETARAEATRQACSPRATTATSLSARRSTVGLVLAFMPAVTLN